MPTLVTSAAVDAQRRGEEEFFLSHLLKFHDSGYEWKGDRVGLGCSLSGCDVGRVEELKDQDGKHDGGTPSATNTTKKKKKVPPNASTRHQRVCVQPIRFQEYFLFSNRKYCASGTSVIDQPRLASTNTRGGRCLI